MATGDIKGISVNTPTFPYWKDYKNVWWHISKPCSVEGCPFIDLPGTNGLCIKHEKEMESKNENV